MQTTISLKKTMIWFYYFIITIGLLFPNTTIVADSSSSIGIQLAVRNGNGGMNKSSCFHNEKQALLNFKASLEFYPTSRLLSTWRVEDDDCCNWSRITCNNHTGHVTELQLRSYLVGGEISPSLLNLTYLNHLDLYFNKFNGTIPSFIGSMTGLRYLDLSYNCFNGTIPGFIGSMTGLRYLDLSYNSFNGTIPGFIGSMTGLRYLGLSFEGTIPNFIGTMTELRHLDLSFEGTIPRFIGNLTQLRYLYLRSLNSFNGTIPPEIGNLTNLRNLSLVGGNELTIENLDWLSNLSHLQHLQMTYISLAKTNYWVDVILSLPKLSFLSLEGCNLSEVVHPYSSFLNSSSSSSIQHLHLYNNNLNSSMYRWLFPLTSNRLVSLDLSNNMLDGIPKYLGNLCSLTSLSIYGNSAVVNFTDFLNNLSGCTSTRLEELEAMYSQFTGSLSDDIQNFSSLQILILSDNNLNGTMSGKVWELPNLEILDVSSNSLRGGGIVENIGKSKFVDIDLSDNSLDLIPSKPRMLNLSYVRHLDLNGNKLGPLFPKWIQTPKNLIYLDIGNTRISDTIPVDFWKSWPSCLRKMDLSSNNISGEVTDLSSNFGFNPIIDLSSNNFSGPIPNVPSTLASLNLSRNKFNGGISFLCQIADGFLSFLDLSHNSLTGQLPDCLWHFKELIVLNLGHNNLYGRLPASIGYLVKLKVLNLYENSFSGELPLALKNCTSLYFLNMGANRFFGNVPIWVGEDLISLYGLILRSNNFIGPIPSQLCYLRSLQILDMSINNLNGTIPSCVNNLKAMVQGMAQERLEEQDWNMYSELYPNPSTTYDPYFNYVDNEMIEWQGNEREFTSNLGLLMSIDLSSNNLTGQIPNELTHLHELLALNLSKNALLGGIPQKVGEMKQLLTLDLSRNKFSGGIPSSMSQMAFLSYLDLSHNRLSGRIPTGTQLQLFERSRYTGNAGLCGPPLTKSCPGDEVPPVASKNESGEEGTDELERWFYIGGSIGFAIGFWIACGTLLVNRRGRQAFFPFVDFSKDWVYVKVMVFIRKLQRVQSA